MQVTILETANDGKQAEAAPTAPEKKGGDTILNRATFNVFTEIVETLSVNSDFRNTVKYLIDKFDYLNGQKDIISTKSKSGKSPLWFAALNDNLEMLKLFESHPEGDFNSHDNRSHWSQLFAAACKSHWRRKMGCEHYYCIGQESIRL